MFDLGPLALIFCLLCYLDCDLLFAIKVKENIVRKLERAMWSANPLLATEEFLRRITPHLWNRVKHKNSSHIVKQV